MNTTTPTPSVPEQLHDDASNLIRDLSAIAGNEVAVTEALRLTLARDKTKDKEASLGLLAAALIVIFSECITTPTEPGEFAETTLPTL